MRMCTVHSSVRQSVVTCSSLLFEYAKKRIRPINKFSKDEHTDIVHMYGFCDGNA
jgi:hypothetical protein